MDKNIISLDTRELVKLIKNGNGTRQTPFLFAITRGQRLGSLIYHTKEEDGTYYQYHLEKVGPNRFTLRCIYNNLKKCTATITISFTILGKAEILNKEKVSDEKRASSDKSKFKKIL